MAKRILACLMLLLGMQTTGLAQGSYEERVRGYIERYKELAMAEQLRSGVPASITLAQGIHETSAGESELCTIANNHFGIKCKKEWNGETFAHTDDAPDECFRKYTRAEDSYTDHSDYLSKSARYASLFKCDASDYKAWATGLKKCGYATNPRYAQMLIKLIEDYNLQEFTVLAMNGEAAIKSPSVAAAPKEIIPEHDVTVITTAPTKAVTVSTGTTLDAAVTPPAYGKPLTVNGLKAVYAKKGDMPLEYAIKNNIRYEKFLEINEIDERPLPYDMFLYLEKKHTKGATASHIVKAGENLQKIAQAEGIQIKSLRAYNMLKPGEEPHPGQVLELQKNVTSKPEVYYTSAIKNPKSGIRVVNEMPSAPAVTQAEPESNMTEPGDEEEKEPAPAYIPTRPTAPATETLVAQAETATESYPASANDVALNTTPVAIPVSGEPEPVAVQEKPETNTIVETYGEVAEVSNEPVAELVPPTPAPAVAEIPAPQSEPVADKKETTAYIPLEPETIIEPKDGPEAASNVGPPVSLNDIPAKKAEVAPVPEPIKEEPKAVVQEVQNTKPTSELDLLKSKFDKVVYARPTPATTTPTSVTETTTPQPEVKEIKVVNNAPRYYVVKRGDTAFGIAKANGISVRQLRDWNSLDFAEIKPGQKLRVQ